MCDAPIYAGSSKKLKNLKDFDERKGPQPLSQNPAPPLPPSLLSGVAQSAGVCTVRPQLLTLQISRRRSGERCK